MSDNKCLGILGKMFGHKYIKTTLEYQYSSDCCYRCGKRKGS